MDGGGGGAHAGLAAALEELAARERDLGRHEARLFYHGRAADEKGMGRGEEAIATRRAASFHTISFCCVAALYSEHEAAAVQEKEARTAHLGGKTRLSSLPLSTASLHRLSLHRHIRCRPASLASTRFEEVTAVAEQSARDDSSAAEATVRSLSRELVVLQVRAAEGGRGARGAPEASCKRMEEGTPPPCLPAGRDARHRAQVHPRQGRARRGSAQDCRPYGDNHSGWLWHIFVT